MDMSRRSFLGGAVSVGCFASVAGSSSTVGQDVVLEPVRRTVVSGTFDVIVAGGGPAGTAAAIAAARAGAKTMLIESHGCLGGIWTSGLVGCMLDFDKGGLTGEIIARLDVLKARKRENRNNFHYEPEYMKLVCEDLCREAGVAVRLMTHVVAVESDPSGRSITAVITESKSGREAWRAKTFVDCTGDGDLAAWAGCGFDLGITPDGFGQPASLDALILFDDAEPLRKFFMHGGMPSPREALAAEMKRAGVEPSYGIPTFYCVHPHMGVLMSNHEYKVRPDDAARISEATLNARREIIGQIEALAKLGGPWKNVRVAATAEQIGIRSARRIHGRYMVTREDLIKGARFEDAVCESRYPADIHALDAKAGRVNPADTKTIRWKPFQIPLRALRARDRDNLWMAGRCISGDAIAHASYRVTGSAVATGTAAGRAAAEAAIA